MSKTKGVVESKTARASRGIAKVKFSRICFACTEEVHPVQCFTETGHKKGMYWVCQNDHREKIHGK